MTSQQDNNFPLKPQIVINEIQNDIKDNKQQMESQVQTHQNEIKVQENQNNLQLNLSQLQEKNEQSKQKQNKNNKLEESNTQIQKPNITIQISDTQLCSNPSIALDIGQEDSQLQKQDQCSQAELAHQKNKKNVQKYIVPVIAAPQQFQKIDLKNEQHQRIIINILQKNRPKNNIETDIMFDLIENLPFFKNNKAVLSQSATTKELLQSLKLEFFQKNEILFSKGDIGNTFYIILSGSAYCLLELQKLEQNPKIKEEGSKKKILFTFDLATNPTFDQEQAALKQILPNMNMVKIFLPGESFGEIALITSQPRTATLILRQDSYLMTLSKEAYNKILGQYDQLILRDRRKFLMNFQCFKYHNYSKLLSLLHFMKIQVFNKKYVLYKEGDKPDHIYFIKQGEVEISKQYDLDKEIEEKDTSLELQQWRTQRKAQIYKLNKVQQIKDKIESLFQIEVVILGQNNCFGEEDIFLNNTKRKSSATVISSSAEIFSIEKQKLFNELNIFQTLDLFEKEFKLKYQQQQINFQKNINSAIVSRKAQLLKNMMKNGVISQSPSNQLQILQACNSPKQEKGFYLPKIFSARNSNFMQQSFGSETPKFQKQTEEDFSQQLQLTQNLSNENFAFHINGGSNYGTPKNKYFQNEFYAHQSLNDRRKNNLQKITQSSSRVNTEPSKFQEFEPCSQMKTLNSQIMNNFDQNPNFSNRTSIDSSQIYNHKFKMMNSQEFLSKNLKPSFEDTSQEGGDLSLFSKEQFAYNSKSISSPYQLESLKLNFIDSSPSQSIDQLKYFRSPKMSKTLIQIKETIRKTEEQKKYSQIDIVNRINKELEEKQLQLVDLNTRSLDLREVSGELLKIYIQKHSQHQMSESLQNIAQQRLLSMSSTLRDTSNNRLYMKYSGSYNSKKPNDIKAASTQRIQTLTSPKSLIQNNETKEDQILNNEKNEKQPESQQNQIVSTQKKKINIQVKIPENSLSDWQDTQQVSHTKSSFNKQESFGFQSVQNTPKSNFNESSKTHKKNEFQIETPLTTTEQFKYFKQQVDFLENSDKYIEKIKKSNNSQIKLSDILQTKEQSRSPYQKQINDKIAKKAFNDSMNLLSQEIFKGQAIKNIQLQRHHSVLLTGQIQLDNISPNTIKFTKSPSTSQDGAFSNFIKNISNFSRLNSLMSEDDDQLSKKSDKIQERSNSLMSMSPIRIKERRSISKFSDSSDQKIDQELIQKAQKVNNNSPLPTNPVKLQTQESVEEIKKMLKNSSSSFKIESTLQNSDTQKTRLNSLKCKKNQEIIDNEQLIKNFKNASNPQLTKLYTQIQRIKRLKDKEKEKDYCNIAQSLQKKVSETQIQQEANDIKQLILSQDKYKDSLTRFKGDQQHYKKIKDINQQQTAIFKHAKLNNRGVQQQQSDQFTQQTPLILQIQQKKISKMQNS
ncbi:cyclic nucleotide-binding domain protein (macronuclear) [Tetrahymena thermophila SB210]|uniref:Cyclic nucleotide-binding domain protein n=1 Tax=Tetrahymena thermophila (strain SB210) TaxID=312017 RepID=I7LXG0_TETTS|nr:cyclic nucleotide-binding domain protein [Tetrahymena thermophila SB210]EAS04571.2 cyclic nucleotide-binding domain protein [Tetrahymena thermophila SB210]|eukprot:XP_001024816.2 cyclic nucleotide-binding domain protein [Tetrahymena thermophila SB210]